MGLVSRLHTSVTGRNMVSHYGYETDDPEVAEKVNGWLEELHQNDDEEDEAAEHDLNPNGLQEVEYEVKEIEGETAEELGCMSPRECQYAMFMLTKVSFAPALGEPHNLSA